MSCYKINWKTRYIKLGNILVIKHISFGHIFRNWIFLNAFYVFVSGILWAATSWVIIVYKWRTAACSLSKGKLTN